MSLVLQTLLRCSTDCQGISEEGGGSKVVQLFATFTVSNFIEEVTTIPTQPLKKNLGYVFTLTKVKSGLNLNVPSPLDESLVRCKSLSSSFWAYRTLEVLHRPFRSLRLG